jgi:hypothetical protein
MKPQPSGILRISLPKNKSPAAFCRVYKKGPIRRFADHVGRRDHDPSVRKKFRLLEPHVIKLGETFISAAPQSIPASHGPL